jgi:hypothetical protein
MAPMSASSFALYSPKVQAKKYTHFGGANLRQ